jgi:hypothetical protein
MSLLEKASGGHKQKKAPLQARTSLFTRAMAAASRDEPEPALAATPAPPPQPIVAIDDLEEIGRGVDAMPSCFDSILSIWSLLSTRLPLAATALFLPQGDFLALAAQSGFPSGTGDAIPVSLAPSSQKNGELLGKEAKALIAPLLGVSLGMELRAAAMWSDVGLAGLWIYYDTSLEPSPPELKSALCSLFAGAAASLPASHMALPEREPGSALLETTRKYRFAVLFRFDLAPLYAAREAFRGLEMIALRSAFLSACQRILSQSGAAFAFGESSVACAFGSSSILDPELALFQFSKTLRRTLPFLAGEAFPDGFAARFDPSSDHGLEELSRFLSA